MALIQSSGPTLLDGLKNRRKLELCRIFCGVNVGRKQERYEPGAVLLRLCGRGWSISVSGLAVPIETRQNKSYEFSKVYGFMLT